MFEAVVAMVDVTGPHGRDADDDADRRIGDASWFDGGPLGGDRIAPSTGAEVRRRILMLVAVVAVLLAAAGAARLITHLRPEPPPPPPTTSVAGPTVPTTRAPGVEVVP